MTALQTRSASEHNIISAVYGLNKAENLIQEALNEKTSLHEKFYAGSEYEVWSLYPGDLVLRRVVFAHTYR